MRFFTSLCEEGYLEYKHKWSKKEEKRGNVCKRKEAEDAMKTEMKSVDNCRLKRVRRTDGRGIKELMKREKVVKRKKKGHKKRTH